MSLRRMLRVVLSGLLIAMIGSRVMRQWRYLSTGWLAGALIVSTILLVVLVMEFSGASERWGRAKDSVLKRPLGLE